jgi:hypothetical protein
MATTKFTPLALGLIDEGRFLDQANADLERLQAELVRFMETHGELAKRAKAQLALTITLTCEDVENKMFSVKALATKKVPNRPPSITLALEGEDDQGEPCLFVRRSGSTTDTPAQGVITTKDGRTVDTETGEVSEGAKPARQKKA